MVTDCHGAGPHLIGNGATCCSQKHAALLQRRGPKVHCMGQPRDRCRGLHVPTFHTHLLNIHLCFNTDSTVNKFVLKMLSDSCFLSPPPGLHCPHTLICSHMGVSTLTLLPFLTNHCTFPAKEFPNLLRA
jgi:hypothetical protein